MRVVTGDGTELPATLTLPTGDPRAGIVVLHGAAEGQRSYFLYEHLARVAVAEGVAVLRYDRRPSLDGSDVPLHTQAADALAGLRHLHGTIGPASTGLWGFSQGAWAATFAAAAEPEIVRFLICVSWCAVSPAEQMRIGCARQLRIHGYGDADVEELTAVRLACERYLRTGEHRVATQSLLDTATTRPWFAHAYLPTTLPDPGSWEDMDVDPLSALRVLTCPVLAFYGETDEWIPLDRSIAAWECARATGTLTDLTLVRLPTTDHLPTVGGRPEPAALSSQCSDALATWLRSM